MQSQTAMQQRTHAHLLLVVTQKVALARDVSLDRLGLCGRVSARVLRAAAVRAAAAGNCIRGTTTRVAAGVDMTGRMGSNLGESVAVGFKHWHLAHGELALLPIRVEFLNGVSLGAATRLKHLMLGAAPGMLKPPPSLG